MAADSTATMTVDFLRARLLSERSVSRASKERADELAKRVAELEEQVRAVTAQRRQAERAAAAVLAVLESQGFGGGHLSDVADDDDDDSDDSADGQDSGEVDDGKRRRGGDTASGATAGKDGDQGEASAEDALSGTGTAQPSGGLSWKGRSVSPRKARQLRHRRSFFYLLSSPSSSDASSPKYRVGQSCRKNKRRVELISNVSRSVATEGEDDGGGGGSQKGRQDASSDFTDDGQADMDGDAGGDERSSEAGGSGGGGGGGQYVIRYEKDGEMERVLERQAELIGQYEEEEKVQREWEKQYNENRNTNYKGDAELKNKAYRTDAEVKSTKNLHITNTPSAERLPNGSLSESLQNSALRRRGANEEPDHGRAAQTSSISAPGSSSNSTVTRQDQDRGDQSISDGDSGYSTNARSPPKHDAIIRAPSDGRSPSSDTLNSKVSAWSSSQFHDCSTDSQLDTQSSSYPPASSCSIADIESVLQALQRARISLSAKLSRPVPPNQVTLALPAPGDEHREYDDDDSYGYGENLSGSSPALQEMLALPAPEDYHEREDYHAEKASSSSPPREEMLALPAPGDDYRKEIEDYYTKIPVGTPGLFRLPIDSFPVDEKMFPGTACGSGFSLPAAADRHATCIFSNPSASFGAATSVASVSSDGSGFPSTQGIDLQASALPLVPASDRCINMPTPDFTVGSSTAFVSGIPGLQDLNRGTPLADADLFMQRGIDCITSNKWML